MVAFIGGLDITDGRYDTPEFQLWSTVRTVQHRGDFYSKCVPGVTEATGPRQPWHDCHARVEGAVALDIMANFTERWRMQAEEDVGALFHPSEDEFDLEHSPEVPEAEGGPWTVQLFRWKGSFSYQGGFVRMCFFNCQVDHERLRHLRL